MLHVILTPYNLIYPVVGRHTLAIQYDCQPYFRGMPVSKIWTVRGISDDIQKRVSEAAQAAGMRLGPWVERVLLDALEGQGCAPSGPGGAGDDLAELVERRGEQLDSLCRLFEQHGKAFANALARLERLEASQVPPATPGLPSGNGGKGRVPPAISSRQGSALDAVEPAEWVEVPETIETHPGASGAGRQKSPLPWTDADWTELRRIFDRGGNEADACRELGRGSNVISGKWATLLEERARRTPAFPATGG
jgi:hypothetical protein